MKKTLRAAASEECILSVFLQTKLQLTKTQIKQAKYRENGICVNGVRCRITEVLHPGDQVTVILEDDTMHSSHLEDWEYPLDILYEDDDIIAINKPAGLVVHPSHGHFKDTLANAVETYFRKQGIPLKIRPIGRLDKETSGVVLFAKNQVAAARLAVQKEQGLFQKEYLALVYGFPTIANGTITAPISSDPDNLLKMKTDDNGMKAVTHYHTVGATAYGAMLHLRIETGRTHQIRVHMYSVGHPLLGDQIYPRISHIERETAIDGMLFSDCPLKRAALHASVCSFQQPFTNEPLRIEAPIPADLQTLIIQTT